MQEIVFEILSSLSKLGIPPDSISLHSGTLRFDEYRGGGQQVAVVYRDNYDAISFGLYHYNGKPISSCRIPIADPACFEKTAQMCFDTLTKWDRWKDKLGIK